MEGLLQFAQAMLDPQPKIVDCPRCSKEGKKSILKYRGSVTNNTHNFDIFLKNWKTNEIYKQLMKYSPPGIEYSSSWISDGNVVSHFTFIACDNCIEPKHIPAFAYFPNGWKMKVFKAKHYGPYDEEINFGRINTR